MKHGIKPPRVLQVVTGTRHPLAQTMALCWAMFSGLGASHAGVPPKPPGVVVAHSPASTGVYLGSPSLAIQRGGDYVVSHDLFGPGSTSDTTRVYGSRDRGVTWRQRAEIKGAFWSSLFVHRGALFLLGTSHQDGDCVIRRSTDEGITWTQPKDATSGLLHADARYHCAPVPVVVHEGRVWRAMEDIMGPDGWGHNFRAFMMSAPVDSDLLDARNWTSSNRLGRDSAWLDGRFGGWLEGNAVVAPEGGVLNILRVDFRAAQEKAAIQRVSQDGKGLSFAPADGFVDLPGGCKKFTIRYDPKSQRYWALTNYVPDRHRDANPERTRNTLALICSKDLRQWIIRSIALYHPDPERHAFQYPDWQIDEDDLVVVSRTAYDDAEGGAHTGHDANYITFHRVARFRELTLQDSPREWRQVEPKSVVQPGP